MSDASRPPIRALRSPLTIPLSGNPLDRRDDLRRNAAGLAALPERPGAQILTLWSGKPLIDLVEGGAPAARLGWRPLLAEEARAEELVFLGELGETPYFARALIAEDDEAALAALCEVGAARFIDLRSIARDLTSADAAIVAEAKSLTDWRAAHRFCAKCGAPTVMTQGGWRADCPSCGAKHFPRTDPVVIMLATRRGADGRDRVILGRQPNWMSGLYSLLAGYVEPGETVEEAARREMLEESGVPGGEVVYLGSQPWPYPSTLMLGVWVEALSDVLDPDLTELEDCVWATRADMRAVLAGEVRTAPSDFVENQPWVAPRMDAIARVIIEAWVEGALDGVAGREIE